VIVVRGPFLLSFNLESEWRAGYFSHAAYELGGLGLQVGLLFAVFYVFCHLSADCFDLCCVAELLRNISSESFFCVSFLFFNFIKALMLPVAQQLTELTSPKYLDVSFFQKKNKKGKFFSCFLC
jgi:hypothetical protein